MSYNWNDEAVLLLIEKFHHNDILWNTANPDNKERNKRTDALIKIATYFDIDKSEVERKLKNITSHYFRERKKMTKRIDAGEEDVEPKWFAYKALDFLRHKTKPLQTTKMEITDDGDYEESQQDITASSRTEIHNSDTDPDISESFNVSKDTSASRPTRDDATIFGEYIASKIRKMDPITTSRVEHQIHNIIYQAEMGKHSRRPSAVLRNKLMKNKSSGKIYKQ